MMQRSASLARVVRADYEHATVDMSNLVFRKILRSWQDRSSRGNDVLTTK